MGIRMFLAGAIVTLAGCGSYDRQVELDPNPITDNRAKILLAKPIKWYDHLRSPFEWMYFDPVKEALRDEGAQAVDVIKNYIPLDLYFAIEDPAVDYLVFTGHGNWSGIQMIPDEEYGAFAANLSESDLETYVRFQSIEPKKRLIRHTCGADRVFGEPDKNEKSSFKSYVITPAYLESFKKQIERMPVQPKDIDLTALGPVSYTLRVKRGFLQILLNAPNLEAIYLQKERAKAALEKKKVQAEQLAPPGNALELLFHQRLARAETHLQRELIQIENEVYQYNPEGVYFVFSHPAEELKLGGSYAEEEQELDLDLLSAKDRYLFTYPYIITFVSPEHPGVWDFRNRVGNLNAKIKDWAEQTAKSRWKELLDLRRKVYAEVVFGDERKPLSANQYHRGLDILADRNLRDLVLLVNPSGWDDETLEILLDQFYSGIRKEADYTSERAQFGSCLVGGDLSRIRGWDSLTTPFTFIWDPVPELLGDEILILVSKLDRGLRRKRLEQRD